MASSAEEPTAEEPAVAKEEAAQTGAHTQGSQPTDSANATAADSDDVLSQPPHGSEVFVGGLPRQATESQLSAWGAAAGEIYACVLPRDPGAQQLNRGYGFIKYKTREAASAAMEKLHQTELADFPGMKLRVMPSQSKNKLYVRNIPRTWKKEDLVAALSPHVKGLEHIELLAHKEVAGENRGFTFLEFYNHAAATLAKSVLSAPGFRLGDRPLTVEFAEPKMSEQPSSSAAAAPAGVKSVFVGNLADSVTEGQLRDAFVQYGEVERVALPPCQVAGKPHRNYGFVHFLERAAALKAVEACQQAGAKLELGNQAVEVKMAKPQVQPSDRHHSGYGQGGGGYNMGRGSTGRGGRGGGRMYSGYGYNDYSSTYGGADYGYGGDDFGYPGGYGRGGFGSSGDWVNLGAAAAGMVPMMLPGGQIGYVLNPTGGAALGATGAAAVGRAAGYSEGAGGPLRGGYSGSEGYGGRGPRYQPY